MPFVAGGTQAVMKLAHALGCLDVDRVLRGNLLCGITGDEAEELYVLVEVFEREFSSAYRNRDHKAGYARSRRR